MSSALRRAGSRPREALEAARGWSTVKGSERDCGSRRRGEGAGRREAGRGEGGEGEEAELRRGSASVWLWRYFEVAPALAKVASSASRPVSTIIVRALRGNCVRVYAVCASA
jgi:hypothetical protein